MKIIVLYTYMQLYIHEHKLEQQHEGCGLKDTRGINSEEKKNENTSRNKEMQSKYIK